MIHADYITEADEHGRRWLVIEPNSDSQWDAARFRALNRPCDICDGSRWSPFEENLTDDCPTCSGTGRHRFELMSPVPHWGTLLRVHVVPGIVLPIYGDCPGYDPYNHICQAWKDGHWYWHADETQSESEQRITLPPAAAPGMWAVQLQEVEHE